ncbi:MAG: winged helix-turn-helix transcriptional regulator [Bacilli bacterium]|nr:winged helix-turn-helix transcriptional regulator [Bacilli bacterium]MBN2876151.1 winged helix-turn-helix transcriptional regulator [Bacilli bacterium]
MDLELIIRVLGEETRYKIFQLLLKDEYCVGGLAKTLKISDAAVSQHIKILREHNIVIGRKVGYYTHLSVNKDTMKEFINLFKEKIEE